MLPDPATSFEDRDAHHGHRDPPAPLRHPGRPCRRGTRPRHGRARPADLLHQRLRVRIHRAGRRHLRHAAHRLLLFARLEPHRGRPGAPGRRPGRRQGRRGRLVGPVRPAPRADDADEERRRLCGLAAPVRRLARADEPARCPLRPQAALRQGPDAGRFRGRDHAGDEGHRLRVDRQSLRHGDGHRRHRRSGQAAQPAAGGGQHPRLPGPDPADRARGRHRVPLDLEVPRRVRPDHRRHHLRRRNLRLAGGGGALQPHHRALGRLRRARRLGPLPRISASRSPVDSSACAISAPACRR